MLLDLAPARRRLPPRLAFVALALATVAGCARGDDCRDFDQLLDRTYGFRPSALDATQQGAKSAAMDSVWRRVHQQPKALLPCLRAAIAKRTDDPFFQFDAGALLVSVDSSREAKTLELATLERTDLADLQLADWVHAVARRSLEGFDTRRAAAKWLALPDSAARYALPEHNFEVTKPVGALFVFGTMAESLATPALIDLAGRARGGDRETVLWLLMQQATPEARRFLAAVPRDSLSDDARIGLDAYVHGAAKVDAGGRPPRVSRDEFVRDFAALRAGDVEPFLSTVERVPDGERDAARVLTVADLPDVRYARRYFLAAGTPEALEYHRDFTGIIEQVQAAAARK